MSIKRCFAGWEKGFYTMKSNKKSSALYGVIKNASQSCRNTATNMTDLKQQIGTFTFFQKVLLSLAPTLCEGFDTGSLSLSAVKGIVSLQNPPPPNSLFSKGSNTLCYLIDAAKQCINVNFFMHNSPKCSGFFSSIQLLTLDFCIKPYVIM